MEQEPIKSEIPEGARSAVSLGLFSSLKNEPADDEDESGALMGNMSEEASDARKRKCKERFDKAQNP